MFAALAIAYAYEQNNALIKADGGAVGLTDDNSALRKWVGVYSQHMRRHMAWRMQHQTDGTMSNTAQLSFLGNVRRSYSVISEMWNPFMENSTDLPVLDTKDIAGHPSMADLVSTHHQWEGKRPTWRGRYAVWVHVKHVTIEGYKTLIIEATGVVVIAVSVMASLQELGLERMWIGFGQGRTLWWIPFHELVSQIGSQKCQGGHIFHAFTGCDVISAFRSRWGKSAWHTLGSSAQKCLLPSPDSWFMVVMYWQIGLSN